MGQGSPTLEYAYLTARHHYEGELHNTSNAATALAQGRKELERLVALAAARRQELVTTTAARRRGETVPPDAPTLADVQGDDLDIEIQAQEIPRLDSSLATARAKSEAAGEAVKPAALAALKARNDQVIAAAQEHLTALGSLCAESVALTDLMHLYGLRKSTEDLLHRWYGPLGELAHLISQTDRKHFLMRPDWADWFGLPDPLKLKGVDKARAAIIEALPGIGQ